MKLMKATTITLGTELQSQLLQINSFRLQFLILHTYKMSLCFDIWK